VNWISSGIGGLAYWVGSGLGSLADWVTSGLGGLADWVTSGLGGLADWVTGGINIGNFVTGSIDIGGFGSIDIDGNDDSNDNNDQVFNGGDNDSDYDPVPGGTGDGVPPDTVTKGAGESDDSEYDPIPGEVDDNDSEYDPIPGEVDDDDDDDDNKYNLISSGVSLQTGGRITQTGLAQVDRGELVTDEQRLVDELASAISTSTNGSEADTSAIEDKLDRLNRNINRLASEMRGMELRTDSETIGRVASEGQRQRVADSDPTV
jgi:hypothetical protein